MNIQEEAIRRIVAAAEKLFSVKIMPETEWKDLLQIEKAMSKAKGSKDAKLIIETYLHRIGVPVKYTLGVDAQTWHSYIFFTEPINMLCLYKTHYLTNFGRMFTGKDEEGTGLNKILAQFCLDNFIDIMVIVRPDKRAWWVPIRELVDYATEHKTGRMFNGIEELHIPVTMLKEFPPEALRGREVIVDGS
jgi:hypothetical protein